MVTAINLGSIFTSGNKTVVGGTASGLDTQSIVKALVDAKSIPVTKLQDQVDANTKKIAAYSDLKSLLVQMQTATKQLSNPPGFNTAADNAFSYSNGTVTSDNGVAGSTYVTMAVSPGATPADYDMQVIKLAKAKSETSTTGFADLTSSVVEAASGTTSGMFSAGVLTLNALGSNVHVTLNQNDTLLDVVGKINNVQGTSGVKATIIKVSASEYHLQLQSTKTGAAYAYNITDDGTGVMSQVAFGPPVAAQDAQFTFNGLTLNRPSNSVNDIVSNVTFNLVSVTPAGVHLTTSIVPDSDTITASIQNFVDTYNKLLTFNANQNLRNDDGTPKEDSILAGNNTLYNMVNQLSQEFSRSVQNTLGTDPNSFDDIGITFTDFAGDDTNPAVSNVMSLDVSKLKAALQSNYDGVRKVFEFDMTSDSQDLVVFKRTNALSVYSFSLAVDPTAGTAIATYDPGSGPVSVPLTYTAGPGGATLIGQTGTPFEGLQLVYTGATSSTINVNITQGMADFAYNDLTSYLDDTTGLLGIDTNALSSQNTDLKKQIDGLNANIEDYRQQLLDKFAQLEKTISQANTLLQSLVAQDSARNSNN